MKLDETSLDQVFPESWKTVQASGSLRNILLALKKDIRAEEVTLGTFTVNPMEEFTVSFFLKNKKHFSDNSLTWRIMGLKSPMTAPNYIPTDIPTATLSLTTTPKSTATASFTLTSADTHTTKITLTVTTGNAGTSKDISLNVNTTVSVYEMKSRILFSKLLFLKKRLLSSHDII